ncbi:MAG: GntR family transcriptional regulator [Lachnospiraceae bacterium]|nr:GntR family transcriptional regulator [Lachnospiraceae bacterium]
MENYMQDAFLPLRDVVFKTLRQAILTGELKPGERLMEIHLANKLGVSRTPIREAIRQLELEGLVIMVPRKGAQVASITEKSLTDVLEVRLALEKLAVELACKRISYEQKEILKEKMLEFEQLAGTDDASLIARADVAFHDAIFESTGNMRLGQMVNNLAEQMYRYRFEYIKDISGHEKLVSEHRLIYDAIIRADIEEATKQISVHIKNQEASIIDQIRSEKGN